MFHRGHDQTTPKEKVVEEKSEDSNKGQKRVVAEVGDASGEVPMEVVGDDEGGMVLEEDVEEQVVEDKPAIPAKRRRFVFYRLSRTRRPCCLCLIWRPSLRMWEPEHVF